MIARSEIGTWALVSAVAVLIWAWAASETRDELVLDSATVSFTIGASDQWTLQPSQEPVTITIEGSKRALNRAETMLRNPLQIEVAATSGSQTLDLVDRLRRHERIEAAGVSLVSVEPASVVIEVDEIVRERVQVARLLPGVQTEGEIIVEPSQVEIAMPSALRSQLTDSPRVTLAPPEPGELQALAPGQPHTLRMSVRPPESVNAEQVIITPDEVDVTLTIRSQTAAYTVKTVRVHTSGPPEDWADYEVIFPTSALRDVTITADAELIRRIQEGEVQVYAIVHLSSADKESGKGSEAVSCFLAVPMSEGAAVEVEAVVAGVEGPPIVEFEIRRRQPMNEGT